MLSLRILVIGGGVFVGRAVVEEALRLGHQVTVFNRGRTAAVYPPGVERIQGDRDADLGLLGTRTWDAVIDVCAYFPHQVESLLSALGGRSGCYLLVSSVAAYASLAEPGIDERSPLAHSLDPAPATVTMESYGPLKAMCDRSALALGPAGTIIVRPCIVIGPWDPTGRFTYWVRRSAAGGEVLAPGAPGAPLQLVDARDLATFILKLAEDGKPGTYNAVGPETLTWGAMLAACAVATSGPMTVTWVDDAFQTAQGVGDSALLPLYVPATATKFAGFYRVRGDAARARGLENRPLEDSVRDIARWLEDPAAAASKQVGLAPERERELLAAWHHAGR